MPHTFTLDKKYNRANIVFEKKFEQSYNIQVLPDAIIDFFGATNDTLRLKARTKAADDYGEINLTLTNADQFPLIVQLVNEKYNVIQSVSIDENIPVRFQYIDPGLYYIRVIFDTNQNGTWDPGNYLRNEQPEEIKYYPARLEVNGNWDLRETFNLE